jgi:hypothetical protein
MDDNIPKPMLNSPIETGITVGEEFEKDKIGRLDRLRAAMDNKPAEFLEQEMERLEKWKQAAIARFSELTGLEFDQDGKCITPGKVRMDGAFKQKWAQVVEEFSAQKDPQKAEQLFGEAGRLLRGAAEKP